MKLMFLTAIVLVFLCSGFAVADDNGSAGPSIFEHVHRAPSTDDTGDSSLTTLFARDNEYAENSFDIIAVNPLEIVGFDCNLDLGATTVSVYYKTGTCDGFEQTPGVWTLLGSETVTGAGADIPTHVNVGGLFIAPGETYGIIITENQSRMEYTNGGPNIYCNASMTIETFRGLALGWPPEATFEYRAWNGTVHYNGVTSLERQTWAGIKTGFI